MASNCEDGKIFVCSLCSKSFKSTDELKSHLVNHNEYIKLKLSCGVCHKYFASMQDLRRHQQISLGFMSMKCMLCLRVFFNENTWKCHMISHTEEHVCSFLDCGIHANKNTLPKDGSSEDETTLTTTKNCSTCKKQFIVRSNSTSACNSIPVNHGSNQCTDCLKLSPINTLLKKKELMKRFEQVKVIPLCSSKENETFICCGEIFSKAETYVKHQSSVHNEKKKESISNSKECEVALKPPVITVCSPKENGAFICCGEVFKDPTNYVNHKNKFHKTPESLPNSGPRKPPIIINAVNKIKTVNRQFRHVTCIKCHQMFSRTIDSSAPISRYMCKNCTPRTKANTIEKYKCNICGVKFGNNINLRIHEKTHNELIYHGKSVPQKISPIPRDTTLHANYRQCYICAESFEMPEDLLSHFATHNCISKKNGTKLSSKSPPEKVFGKSTVAVKKHSVSNRLPDVETGITKNDHVSQKEADLVFFDAICQSSQDVAVDSSEINDTLSQAVTMEYDENYVEPSENVGLLCQTGDKESEEPPSMECAMKCKNSYDIKSAENNNTPTQNVTMDCDNMERFTSPKNATFVESKDKTIIPAAKKMKTSLIKKSAEVMTPECTESNPLRKKSIECAAKELTPLTENNVECKAEKMIQSKDKIFEHEGQVLISSKGKTLFTCKYCDRPFKNQGLVKRHEQDHIIKVRMPKVKHPTHLNGTIFKQTYVKPYQCPFCPKAFSVMTCFSKHLEKHKSPKAYQCYICAQAFDDTHELVSHLLTHNPVSVTKKVLKEQLKNQSPAEEVRHFSRYDRSTALNRMAPVFQCYICAKFFNNTKKLAEHSKIHKSEESSPQEQAKPETHVSPDLQTKSQNGIELKNNTANYYQCFVCAMYFNTSRDLLIHYEAHDPNNGASNPAQNCEGDSGKYSVSKSKSPIATRVESDMLPPETLSKSPIVTAVETETLSKSQIMTTVQAERLPTETSSKSPIITTVEAETLPPETLSNTTTTPESACSDLEVCFFDAACQNIEQESDAMGGDDQSVLPESGASVSDCFPVELVKKETDQNFPGDSECDVIFPDFDESENVDIKIEEDTLTPIPTELYRAESVFFKSDLHVINVPDSLHISQLELKNAIRFDDSRLTSIL